MLGRRAASVLGVLVIAAACDRAGDMADTGAAPSPSASAGGPERLGAGDTVVKEPLSERTAFDLVRVGSGALLVLGSPEGEVHARRIDDAGTVAPPVLVAKGVSRVVEIAAAEGGGQLAVAWVEQGDVGVRARVALGDTKSLSFAVPLELGAATLSTTERGHVSVAALGGGGAASGEHRFVVFHRGGKEPCDDAPSGCVVFPLHQVDETGARPRRVTLSVPAPCGRGVAGFATSGDRWYYGVCALGDGRSSTTMFTIEHTPEYAQAETVLPGCVPLDTAVLGGEAMLVGLCGRDRRAVWLGRREAEVRPVGLTDVSVTCARGVPRLQATGSRSLDVSLADATGGIASLLPPELAPLDARALWTGKVLLVAAAFGQEVAVRAHRCVGG